MGILYPYLLMSMLLPILPEAVYLNFLLGDVAMAFCNYYCERATSIGGLCICNSRGVQHNLSIGHFCLFVD